MTAQKYFIGIPLAEGEREAIEELRAFIERRFGLAQTKRIPAHFTLVPPFMAEDIGMVEQQVRLLAGIVPAFPVATDGFGSFDTHTWYIGCVRSSTLLHMKYLLRGAVEASGCTLPPNLGDTFHVSVAVDVPTPELHAEIGAFLANMSPMKALTIGAITVYRRGPERWEEVCRYRMG